MSPERWQRIEQIYYDALERAAEERALFLAEACADDATLIPEIEALLAANEQASGFLTKPAMQMQAQEMASDQSLAHLGIQPGQHLSHYKILSRIGAGGMGEVYLARDSSLERRVALKLLPVQFTQDVERLQRFVREAKAASALNHPNIITIYEIGEVKTAAGKMHFIATEFIEGVTLRAWEPEDETKRLNHTLAFGVQIASALDAAHQSGIVHRDIKPENLMVRPDGLVKVLDFGLAKLTATNNSGDSHLDSEAQTTPAEMQTTPGVILGTLRYMSPEQARGRALDARTDMFSLGVVLYELLTGKPLFGGETTADVIASIIHTDPLPLSTTVPGMPPELDRIIGKVLAKDRELRYQTARDLLTDLQQLKESVEFKQQLMRSGQTLATSSSGNHGLAASIAQRWFLLAGGLFLLVMLAVIVWKQQGNQTKPTPSLTKMMDERVNSGQFISRISFSPDGKLIAYSLKQGKTSALWIRQLEGGIPKQISDGNWNDRDPVWSPNGQQLAFLSDRGGTPGVWKMSYLGEATPSLLQPLSGNSQHLLKWSVKASSVFYENNGNLHKLDLTNGQTNALTRFESKTAQEFSLSLDEEWCAFTDNQGGKRQVMILPLSGTHNPTPVTTGKNSYRSPVWFPDNKQLAFSSDRNGRFQVYLGGADGREPELLLFTDDNASSIAISPAGEQLISSGARENANLIAIDSQSGQETSYSNEFGLQLYPELSPDGKQLVYQATNANINLNEAVMLKSKNPNSQSLQLTAPGFHAKWSPKGESLAFIRYVAGQSELRKVSVSGRNERVIAQGVKFSGQTAMPYYRLGAAYQWSPDGSQLVYHSSKSGVDNLWIVAEDGTGDRQLTNYTDAQFRLESPFWSPDGRSIAFYVTDSPASGTRKRSLFVATLDGQVREIYSAEKAMNLLGWAAGGSSLVVALSDNLNLSLPSETSVFNLEIGSKQMRKLAQLSSVYFFSFALSPDQQRLAAISRESGTDNLVTAQLNNGEFRRVSNNTDPTVYYSGLTWSPDSKSLFLSKQTEWLWMSSIKNFR